MLPLIFMVVVGLMVRSSLHGMMGGGAAEGPFAEMQKQAQDEMMKAISVGFGTYLSVLVSLYLAAVSAKQFLVARAVNSDVLSKPNKAIA